MSDNNLREFFSLDEGANDKEYREIAMSAADSIVSALKTGKMKPKLEDSDRKDIGDGREVPGETHYAVYDLEKFDARFKDLELAIGVSDGGIAGGTYARGRSKKMRISITGTDTNGDYIGSAAGMKKWKSYVSHGIGNFLDRHRDVFVHEFIHHLDRMRIPTAVWGTEVARAGRGGESYYNNPVELNAFMQMGMSKLANKFKTIKTRKGAEMMVGKTPQDFYKKLEQSMDPKFIKALTPDNKRRLQKRSYQLWQDVMAKFTSS